MAKHVSTDKRRGFKHALIFLIPGLALLITFMIVPFASAFIISFTNMRLIARIPARFIGFDNYIRMFQDDVFGRSLLNIFYFVAVVVPIQTMFALGLAILVNKKIKGATFFRTVYFLPTVTVMVVVSVIWSFLYHPEGLLNGFMNTITLGNWTPIDFLNNKAWAFPAIMLMSIWQGVGFQMLIYLAGLQGIPESLYEAATIDGANARKQFLYITLPQLRSTTTFVVISTTILAFRLFDQVYMMTGGGPERATYTVMLHIYTQGFVRQNVGYASALTVVFFLIVLGISITQRFILKEEREVA
ncbi:MAG TPA: ABC transporter permease [Kosmotogaceae bacterium]|nr:ABC transporter permease [Kosmotogaceae bacterium]